MRHCPSGNMWFGTCLGGVTSHSHTNVASPLRTRGLGSGLGWLPPWWLSSSHSCSIGGQGAQVPPPLGSLLLLVGCGGL